MTINKLLDELNIDIPGYYDGDKYIIDLETSDEYLSAYSRVDNYANSHLIDDNNLISEDTNKLVYEVDEYEVTLLANFNDNKYQIIIEELS